MTGSYRPGRSQDERNARAIQSTFHGTLGGRVAQAMPVRHGPPPNQEDVDPDIEEWLAFGGKIDRFDVTEAGPQTNLLSYVPIEDTEHVRWHPGAGGGVPQEREQWERSGATLTLTDPTGVIKPGDLITVQYLHTYNALVPSDPGFTAVPLGGTWRYKIRLGGHTTDPALAQPGYDDSSWPEGQTPFTGGMYDTVWMRRWVKTHGGTRLKIFADYVDDRAKVYLDGTLIWSPVWDGFGANHTYYTGTLSAGEHLVAVDGWNQGSGGMGMPFELYEEAV